MPVHVLTYGHNIILYCTNVMRVCLPAGLHGACRAVVGRPRKNLFDYRPTATTPRPPAQSRRTCQTSKYRDGTVTARNAQRLAGVYIGARLVRSSSRLKACPWSWREIRKSSRTSVSEVSGTFTVARVK